MPKGYLEVRWLEEATLSIIGLSMNYGNTQSYNCVHSQLFIRSMAVNPVIIEISCMFFASHRVPFNYRQYPILSIECWHLDSTPIALDLI